MLGLVLSVFVLIVCGVAIFGAALIPIYLQWHRNKDQRDLLDLERGEGTRSPQFEDQQPDHNLHEGGEEIRNRQYEVQHLHDLERGEEARKLQLATISLILQLTHVRSDDERIVMKFRNNACVICLEDFKVGEDCQVLFLCKHVFHSDCLKEWLVRNQRCPLCRIPVLLEVFLCIYRVQLTISPVKR
ncbi:unnamed protein product [Dovyalis caffra]|uniref:RING-type domain-containing protein n=1 Tax=Dovyalis caffra TaxID=77055 RepID=A0AAV1R3V1_9ROSI|nr:unnamed protein product [Dovyalis caffra]